MKRVALALAGITGALALTSVVGCSSTDDPLDQASSSGSETADAGSDAEAATPDPSGGRNDSAPNCFAACQNSGFQCLAKGAPNSEVSTVELTPRDSTGCAGTWTTSTGTTYSIALMCRAKTVCTGPEGADPTTCVNGTYSAFNFAFTPAGSTETICTRN